MQFLMRARAVAFFPGGFGTLDELFETLTLLQTGKIKPIPLLMFGRAWWSRLIRFETLVEDGMIDPKDLGLITWVETAEEGASVLFDAWRERLSAQP
jgi:predicted Rossmann-fold nucleotide-binding protein